MGIVGYMLSEYKLKKFKKQFSKANQHNTMSPVNIFDLSQVAIGDFSWGGVKVINYDASHKTKLHIGAFCSIASETTFLLGGNHRIDRVSTFLYKQSKIIIQNLELEENILDKGDIIVEDDVWIGYGALILSGAHIGRGAIIGARSVVAGYVPPYSVYVGNKVIKYRFSDEIITELLKIDYKLFCRKLKENPNQMEKYLYQDVTVKSIREMIEELR